MQFNILEAKTQLSKVLEEHVAKGETVILCKRNVPVAEIRPIRPQRTEPRAVGLAKGKIRILRSFFEPLPPKLEDSFRAEKR